MSCSFQQSIESDLELLGFCFTLLRDRSKEFVLLSQPIRCKTNLNLTNLNLVTRAFPRLTQVTFFYFKFSLIIDDVNLFSDW